MVLDGSIIPSLQILIHSHIFFGRLYFISTYVSSNVQYNIALIATAAVHKFFRGDPNPSAFINLSIPQITPALCNYSTDVCSKDGIVLFILESEIVTIGWFCVHVI